MVDHRLVNDPEHWLRRAEEARTLAQGMQDPISRRIMLGVVKDYEQLAERARLRQQRSRRKSKENDA